MLWGRRLNVPVCPFRCPYWIPCPSSIGYDPPFARTRCPFHGTARLVVESGCVHASQVPDPKHCELSPCLPTSTKPALVETGGASELGKTGGCGELEAVGREFADQALVVDPAVGRGRARSAATKAPLTASRVYKLVRLPPL